MARHLNVIITGKSGVGKSSFLNYLVGQDLFATGDGSPVTQSYFQNVNYTAPDTNVTYCLFDTMGIEPNTADDCRNKIVAEIQRRDKSQDMFDWIHTVYFCFSALAQRIESYEIKFIKELMSYTSVIILLTKKDKVTEEALANLKDQLHKELGAKVQIFGVCSVTLPPDRKGRYSKPEGKEEVLKHSFLGLWEKLSIITPKRYVSRIVGTKNPLANKSMIKCMKKFLLDQEYANWEQEYISLWGYLRNLPALDNKGSYSVKDYESQMKTIENALIRVGKDMAKIDVKNRWKDDESLFDDVFDFYQQVNGYRPHVLYYEMAKNCLLEIEKYDMFTKVEKLKEDRIAFLACLKEVNGTWFFDANERGAAYQAYGAYQNHLMNIAMEVNNMIENFTHAFEAELVQYGQYCIRKDDNSESYTAGRNEEKKRIVYHMKSKGYTSSHISKITDIPLEEVERFG